MSPRQKFLPGSYHDPQEEQNYSFTQDFLRKSISLHSQQKEGRGSYEIYKGISLATIRNDSTFLFQKNTNPYRIQFKTMVSGEPR